MKDNFIGLVISISIAFVAGVMIGDINATNRVKKEAVIHNAAYFDSKTAKFKWRIFKDEY